MSSHPVSRRTGLTAATAVLELSALPRAGRAAAAARVGMIPDAGATQASVDQKKPLRDYLAAKLSRDVELVIPTNYNATVEALGNGSLDFAYLGGLTYANAHALYGVIPLVQPTSDREFHSLFIITQTASARISFSVCATDFEHEIGEGLHERRVVDRARFDTPRR